MEKYRKALDQVISTLTLSEFQNSTTLYDVVKAIQKNGDGIKDWKGNRYIYI